MVGEACCSTKFRFTFGCKRNDDQYISWEQLWRRVQEILTKEEDAYFTLHDVTAMGKHPNQDINIVNREKEAR